MLELISLKDKGYILFDSIFDSALMNKLKEEFSELKSQKLDVKDISILNSYDAEQRRFEIMTPPFLSQIHKNKSLNALANLVIEEPMRSNNRCGYFHYLEGSYIKPHFDHILTDCMLLVCLERSYGKGVNRGGILKLYIPPKITFDSKEKKCNPEACQIKEIDLKTGSAVLVAGGHILHECTPLEVGGSRLLCGMGYAFTRKK